MKCSQCIKISSLVGFEIVGVSGDVPGEEGKKMLGDYIKAKGVPWPNLWDGRGPNDGIAREWGISSWPTQFLVDKKGILRFSNIPADRRKASRSYSLRNDRTILRCHLVAVGVLVSVAAQEQPAL